MINKSWTATIEEDKDGELILPFDKEMLDEMDWREGDSLDFQVNESDGSCIITNLSWQDRQCDKPNKEI